MKKSNIICCVIAVITLLSLVYIWPLGLLNVTYEEKSKERYQYISKPLDLSNNIRGNFVPSYDYLKTMSFKFSNNDGKCTSGNLMLTIQDENESELYSDTIDIKNLLNGNYFDYSVDLKLQAGNNYYYILSASDYKQDPPCIYLGSSFIGPYEHRSISYNNENIPNTAPYATYTYEGKPSIKRALPYYVVICLIAVIALIASCYPTREVCSDKKK